MKSKKYFSIVFLFSSLLNFGIVENANANLKKNFQQNREQISSCNFESAEYESIKADIKNNKRYCIRPDKRVMSLWRDGSKYTAKGFLGKQELYYGEYSRTYLIDQWELEDEKLIKYSCSTNSVNGDCTGKLFRKVIATKRSKNSSPSRKIEQTQISTNSNSLRNGKHTYIWENGDKYIGEWVNGKMTGEGTMLWKNGNKYVGNFINGRMEGKGRYIWANGNRYSGDFMNNTMTGKGTIFLKSGDQYIGEWVNGKITGKGTMIWKNGSKYVGNFLNGKMEGYGIFTNIRGQEFEGEFENGNLIKKY